MAVSMSASVLDVPNDKIAERLDASVEDILAQAAKPVPVSNDGADIDAVIVASRAKLRDLDTAGALVVLQAKIAGEEQERARRLVPLLKERAEIERLAFDYDAAKQTLAEVTRLAPDDVWAFIDLGDLYVTTGPLEEAAKAFRNAEAAARRQGDERNLSVAFNRLGDVQVEQGDLAGARNPFPTS
jgi:tetratricopeptide (TPR) repeat protein